MTSWDSYQHGFPSLMKIRRRCDAHNRGLEGMPRHAKPPRFHKAALKCAATLQATVMLLRENDCVWVIDRIVDGVLWLTLDCNWRMYAAGLGPAWQQRCTAARLQEVS